jgi:DNA mismatch repair ATPase MutS
MISGMLLPPWIQTGGTTSQIAQRWIQWGASVFMFGSSIWQQVTLSRHLHTITEDMRKRGSLIIELHEIRKQLADIIGPAIEKYMDLPSDFDLPGENTLQIFGYTWNNPSVIEKVTTMIGKLDVMVTCASLRKIGFPVYAVNSDKTDSRLYIENFFHPHLLRENKKNVIITNTLDLHKGNTFNHALVTGPNRGGKSTSLKSILTNVVLAQSLGICFAKKMEFTPFKQIHTALSPSDTLGRLSLFETEIEFAKEILENLTKEDAGRALLVMDEIFHSTNAIDGEEASKIFLEKLYQLPMHMSLISTHYIKLPETYTERKLVESLCLTAKKGPEDTLIYSYKMKKGINSLSSVREILKERGLL